MGKSKEKTAADKGQGGQHGGVWVFGDLRTEALKKATASLLDMASGLATKRSAPLSLVLLGRNLDPHLASFRQGPADQVLFMDHPRLEHYRQEFQMSPSPIPISGQRRNRYALGCALCQCGVPCESLDPFISPGSVAKNARY